MRTANVSFSLDGLTLIEVLIAIAVFAAGIVAVFGMQATALRTNRGLAEVQVLMQRADAELDMQRARFELTSAPSGPACISDPSPLDVSIETVCTVTILDCEIDATNVAACDTSGAGNAYLVQVNVSLRDREREVVLFRVLGERPFYEEQNP